MPELPEVESVRRNLMDSVLGRRIESVTLIRGDYLRHQAFPISQLAGRKLCNIDRLGKRLFWYFEPALCMTTHLGMSGRITLLPSSEIVLAHTHLIISAEGNKHLHFSDPRRFGGIWLYASGQDAMRAHIHGRMGVDALQLRPEDLTSWRRKKTRLKAELLNQKTVAGLGNIYIDEALWMARLHPLQKVCRLSTSSRAELVRCIGRVLNASLRHGGTTLRDYRDAKANRGTFAQRLTVYGKAGQPCKRCGAVLRGLLVMQRSTVICPKCQSRKNQGAESE
ncbi:MAG: bifunctional DNA-formamidopyrimidine glycosylase/DNA-(apurinic or apyrimidinic site) lyase [Phycisphaerae bacterium]